MKIELPQVGESVTDGVISRWLKNIGDSIEEYEPLVEVVTDKVNMEVPCPVSGILTNILVQEGETVPMGTTIAEINVGDESVSDLNNDSDEGITKDTKLDRIGTLLKDVSPVGPTGSGGPISEGIEIDKSKRQRYSPAVIRLAKQHNIDLNLINGTGIGGRVSKKDVQLFINSKAATTEKMDGVDVMPITPLRRLIANNMVESSNQIPDAWTMVEADVSGLVDLRENTKELFIKREGVKLTYLAFVVNIVSRALKAHSKLNSTWERESIILKNRINIGVAVSTTTGLVVPVIHDADKLSIGDHDTITAIGAVSVDTNVTFINNVDGAGNLTLAAGVDGQIKIIIMSSNTGGHTVTLNAANIGSDISWDAAGESATLLYDTGTSKWYFIGGNATTA